MDPHQAAIETEAARLCGVFVRIGSLARERGLDLLMAGAQGVPRGDGGAGGLAAGPRGDPEGRRRARGATRGRRLRLRLWPGYAITREHSAPARVVEGPGVRSSGRWRRLRPPPRRA